MVYGSVSHPFGMDVMSAHADNFKADFIITNFDAWVMEPPMLFNKRWVAWFPIDSEPCPPPVIEKVKQAWHRIIWTQRAKREMDKAGLECDYVPYGVDTKVFRPMDRVKARETTHMPADKFIVGQVAMNKGYPPRKAFFENIAAFKRLHDKHPDTLLYLHTLDGTRPNGEAIDLVIYCKAIGLQVNKDVIFADQYSYAAGNYPDEAMATLYNCFDVHCLVSMGEGFGVPQLEAQACGTPVICGDWTSMSELFFSGWKVARKDATPMWTIQNTYQFLPHVGAIADKLEQAYKMRGNTDYQKRAREGAMEYDIDKVVEKYWTPALAKIEQKLKETPATQDNIDQNMAVLR